LAGATAQPLKGRMDIPHLFTVSTVGSQKSMDPINWVIPLHDVPCDFDKRSALFTEMHVEREQSGSYRLHSPQFKGVIAANIKTVAKEIIDNINKILGDDGSITMGIPIGIRADGVQVTLVTTDLSMPIESQTAVISQQSTPMEFLTSHVHNVWEKNWWLLSLYILLAAAGVVCSFFVAGWYSVALSGVVTLITGIIGLYALVRTSEIVAST
jgi:hypothetical protein